MGVPVSEEQVTRKKSEPSQFLRVDVEASVLPAQTVDEKRLTVYELAVALQAMEKLPVPLTKQPKPVPWAT